MNLKQSSNNEEFVSKLNDEIDLKKIFIILMKKWPKIALFALVGVFVSGTYAFTRKPIWAGQFEIVLSKRKESSPVFQGLIDNNSSIASLLNISSGGYDLKTEVAILESPSVLLPVFDFVKSTKKENNVDISTINYFDWLSSSLSVELIGKTRILNIKYYDTDKDLILPVLNKISNQYQSYSGKDREVGLNNVIKYLNDQIIIYKQRSSASLQKSEKFAIEQDLTALKGFSESYLGISNKSDIEESRVSAANAIRNIEEQLKKLESLSDDPEAVMFRGLSIPVLAKRGLYKQLDQYDIKLAFLRSRFTDSYPPILELEESRKVLIEVLKKQTFGYLNAQISDLDSKIKAFTRPKGVLIKYRELARQAFRDIQTLSDLEQNLQIINLEKAKFQEPWELISSPTSFDRPSGPRKRNMIAQGLFAGLIFGSGYVLFASKKSGLIIDVDEVKNVFDYPFLQIISSRNINNWNVNLSLIAKGPLSIKKDGKVAIIPVGAIDPNLMKKLTDKIADILNDKVVIQSDDLLKTRDCLTQLIVVSPGVSTKYELIRLSEQLSLQGTSVAGWIYLDNQLIA